MQKNIIYNDMKLLRFNESIKKLECICKKSVKFTNDTEYIDNEIYNYYINNNLYYVENIKFTCMTSDTFLDYFIPNFKYSEFFKKFYEFGDLSFANFKFCVNSYNSPYMNIEKKVGGKNFLTVIYDSTIDKFIINVTSGTINNPSKAVGSNWYDLKNRKGENKHDISDVYDVLINYGIATKEDKEFNLSVNKYNL